MNGLTLTYICISFHFIWLFYLWDIWWAIFGFQQDMSGLIWNCILYRHSHWRSAIYYPLKWQICPLGWFRVRIMKQRLNKNLSYILKRLLSFKNSEECFIILQSFKMYPAILEWFAAFFLNECFFSQSKFHMKSSNLYTLFYCINFVFAYLE